MRDALRPPPIWNITLTCHLWIYIILLTYASLQQTATDCNRLQQIAAQSIASNYIQYIPLWVIIHSTFRGGVITRVCVCVCVCVWLYAVHSSPPGDYIQYISIITSVWWFTVHYPLASGYIQYISVISRGCIQYISILMGDGIQYISRQGHH